MSLSPGYLEMLRCDNSNQQARQSWQLSVLIVTYHYLLYVVFLVHWNQLSPFLSKPFCYSILFYFLILRI